LIHKILIYKENASWHEARNRLASTHHRIARKSRMRVLAVVLMLLGLVVALALLLPIVGAAIALLIVAGGFVVWLLPILIIAFSDRTTGPEKLAWILAIVFLSWFAWIFYFLLAPISKPGPRYYLRDERDRYSHRDRYDYRYR